MHDVTERNTLERWYAALSFEQQEQALKAGKAELERKADLEAKLVGMRFCEHVAIAEIEHVEEMIHAMDLQPEWPNPGEVARENAKADPTVFPDWDGPSFTQMEPVRRAARLYMGELEILHQNMGDNIAELTDAPQMDTSAT